MVRVLQNGSFRDPFLTCVDASEKNMVFALLHRWQAVVILCWKSVNSKVVQEQQDRLLKSGCSRRSPAKRIDVWNQTIGGRLLSAISFSAVKRTLAAVVALAVVKDGVYHDHRFFYF